MGDPRGMGGIMLGARSHDDGAEDPREVGILADQDGEAVGEAALLHVDRVVRGARREGAGER